MRESGGGGDLRFFFTTFKFYRAMSIFLVTGESGIWNILKKHLII